MTNFERRFLPQPSELRPTRAALRTWLHDADVDTDAASDVLVVSSELVTNGIVHDGGDLITLRADRQDADVSIEVTTVDHQPGQHPTYRDVENSDEGGRGLEIVRSLTHDYSVTRYGNERVTACQVTTRGARSESVVLACDRPRGHALRTLPSQDGAEHIGGPVTEDE
jgi:anti-sigma regulatory factor (Ser/Thr protein kinase)